VFVGNPGYPPNREGLRWFLHEIAPRIGTRFGLDVVGDGAPVADPPAGVSVRSHGFRRDIRPWLRGAAAAVCPLRLAAGLQNKAVQAMACGTPVVATPNVGRSLGARAGRDMLLAPTAGSFAAACRALLDRPALRRRIGTAGRRLALRLCALPAAERELERAVARLGHG
jgi:glycosyltransferase involved in cell wall biosynthesis